jgi:hypothetical protein
VATPDDASSHHEWRHAQVIACTPTTPWLVSETRCDSRHRRPDRGCRWRREAMAPTLCGGAAARPTHRPRTAGLMIDDAVGRTAVRNWPKPTGNLIGVNQKSNWAAAGPGVADHLSASSTPPNRNSASSGRASTQGAIWTARSSPLRSRDDRSPTTARSHWDWPAHQKSDPHRILRHLQAPGLAPMSPRAGVLCVRKMAAVRRAASSDSHPAKAGAIQVSSVWLERCRSRLDGPGRCGRTPRPGSVVHR